MEIKEQS